MLKYLLGRRLIQHVDKFKLNGYQIYARKGGTTYEVLIIIRVIYDMIRLQRDYLISLFNDLKGNFNRIRPAPTPITTKRIRLPKLVAICHAQELCKMRHNMMISFGISEESIGWDIK